jgi:GNAT superfamily N-acetyltransferase
MGFPLADGYHLLPPGKLAAVVTWLEMRDRPAVGPPLPEGVTMIRDPGPEVEEYRRIFREIGEPWLWFGRLEMSDQELAAHLGQEGIEVYWLNSGGIAIGLLELDRRTPTEVEIVYFGLVGGWTGRGAGSAFMAAALDVAWRDDTSRVWLHTCTLDHPRALVFYQKFGFVSYQRGLELYDDPRLSGILPRDAGPQVPIL